MSIDFYWFSSIVIDYYWFRLIIKFVIFLNKAHHKNEQTIQLSLFVVFYVKFVCKMGLTSLHDSYGSWH